VVVEGVNDHENLGAIFRNSAVLAAGAVLLDPSCCDPLYRRCVRVSLGHVMRVPFARLSPWPQSLELLSDAGFTLVALDPQASQTLDTLAGTVMKTEQRSPSRFAILVGAEGPGLSARALMNADVAVRIPMAGPADCLNVATSAAVALYTLTQAITLPDSKCLPPQPRTAQS
jgi:tRNA G18 (ribose-2'-O)-methylase SpoU